MIIRDEERDIARERKRGEREGERERNLRDIRILQRDYAMVVISNTQEDFSESVIKTRKSLLTYTCNLQDSCNHKV